MTTSATYSGIGAPTGSAELADALRRGRRRLLIGGVLATVLGIVAIVVPAVASVATALFIGWILIIAGGLQFADAFAVPDRGRTALRAVLAMLTFAAGLYLVLAPLDGAFTLTVMLTMWFVASGVARIASGIAERGVPGTGRMIVNGMLSLVLGLLLALQLPESAGWAIGLLVGVDLLFAGTSLIWLSRELRPLRVAPA